MYTGDDFNFAERRGRQRATRRPARHFDPIAPVAAAGLSALAQGDRAGFDALLAPTVPLSRHVFCAPTRSRIGVVFIAWLNGRRITS
jgi:hypothetical protein